MIVTTGSGSVVPVARMLKFVEAVAVPLALVTVTSSVCAPTESVLLAAEVQATAAAVSHLQVVDVASVDVHVAASGVVQVVFGSGFRIFTVGAFSALKVLCAVVLPDALVAFT